MKIKIPDKDYYSIDDTLKMYDITLDDLYHYTNEKKCLRFAYLKKHFFHINKYKCLKVTKEQAKFIRDDMPADLEQLTDVNDRNLLENIFERYEEETGNKFNLLTLDNLPSALYIIPNTPTDYTLKRAEGFEAMYINRIFFFHNFIGELFFIFEEIKEHGSEKLKYYLSGPDTDGIDGLPSPNPVLTLEEKNRFENEIPIENEISLTNESININNQRFYTYQCHDLDILIATVNEFWNKKKIDKNLIRRNVNQSVIAWIKREYPEISDVKAEYIAKLIRPDIAN